jgi:hypothetical protein
MKPTRDIITKRQVTITIESGANLEKTVAANLIPVNAPIDHTFRFNEPENSHFRVIIPPFAYLLNTPVGLKCSHTMGVVNYDEKTK